MNIAQASRISGVNPADISILLVYLEQGKLQKGEKLMNGIEWLAKELSEHGIELSDKQKNNFKHIIVYL